MAYGFPLGGALASSGVATTGTVSALAGLGDDQRVLQISAPVQPGNSGGPLLDEKGFVVGVVVSKLNAMAIAEAIGDIPQNVNFAVKGTVAKELLRDQGLAPTIGRGGKVLGLPQLADLARSITIAIRCSDP